MHRVFGQFLDDAVNIPLDKISCGFVLSLIQIMSQSFRNTQTKSAKKSTRRSLGLSNEGSERGHEFCRASEFRRLLLGYLKSLLPSLDLDSLEPAQPNQVITP